MAKKKPATGGVKPSKPKSAAISKATIRQVRPGLITFELDLLGAVINELQPGLDAMTAEPLTVASVNGLPNEAGVYLLLHRGEVAYVGKTDSKKGLAERLLDHAKKVQNRHSLDPADVTYKAARVYVMTPMAIEKKLIDHFGPAWNGSSFGSHDPGRERETTNKPAKGFDSQFPIDIDRPLGFLLPGSHTVHSLLIALKEGLTCYFRFETMRPRYSLGYKVAPHPDYTASSVTIPNVPVTTRDVLKLVVGALPHGWQATLFPSHVILYKESRAYRHGKRL